MVAAVGAHALGRGRPRAALVVALVFAGSAAAGIVAPFVVQSALMANPPQQAGNEGDTFGLLAADVDAATYGYVHTHMTTADFSITMQSEMLIFNNLYLGKSSSDATYQMVGTNIVKVDWNWANLNKTGGWSITDATGATVAALSFTASSFTTTGGNWSKTSIGTAYVTLGAGTYGYHAFYQADQMPTSSRVDFNLHYTPAPGALALMGMAGLGGRRRRRR